LQNRATRRTQADLAFRVRMGEYEVEIQGKREEVLKTLQDLPSLIDNVNKAFENVKPKKITTLTVKTEPAKEESTPSQKYPKISPTENYEEAIIRILETDWGKWRPRTIDELRDALKANGMDYPGRMLAGILMGFVKNEKIRRWNTDAGYVYILAEKEAFRARGAAQ
jgi:hypothetical protein